MKIKKEDFVTLKMALRPLKFRVTGILESAVQIMRILAARQELKNYMMQIFGCNLTGSRPNV